ncbi:very short patch repair endonuclease [Pseudoxanthomonas beigongshangi]
MPITPINKNEERSAIMRSVRRRNTKPELVVRKILFELGYRYRLHKRELPGTPDIVLPPLRLAIFVHGCFWHRHANCKYASTPTTNREFWTSKFENNVARDLQKEASLRSLGWSVEIVWECETRDLTKLSDRLVFLLSFPIS